MALGGTGSPVLEAREQFCDFIALTWPTSSPQAPGARLSTSSSKARQDHTLHETPGFQPTQGPEPPPKRKPATASRHPPTLLVTCTSPDRADSTFTILRGAAHRNVIRSLRSSRSPLCHTNSPTSLLSTPSSRVQQCSACTARNHLHLTEGPESRQLAAHRHLRLFNSRLSCSCALRLHTMLVHHSPWKL